MSSAVTKAKGPIFREYIGVKPDAGNTLPCFPGEIINPKIHEFHFILGFAKELYDQDGKGTGIFSPDWNLDYFGPERVRELKERYGNVKVVISIGGRDPQYRFNPARRETWLDNAIRSLKEIIEHYNNKIDGIDINYQHIDPDIGIDVFADYMGEGIGRLKKQVSAIKVVSIAPSDRVAPYYRTLYQFYHAQINWVDYQFYIQQLSSVRDFVKLYRRLSSDFDASKLLAGGSTDRADAGNMPPEVFIEGIRELIKKALIFPGAFVWNANDSAAHPRQNENRFFLEEKIQAILTGSDQ